MSRWYSITQADGESSAAVDIDGVIGWEVTSRDFRREVNALDVTDLHVNVNSIGGATGEGIAIKNVLKKHPANVHVHVDGYALSSGSIIAMGGDTVTMSADAGFMIHAPWNFVAGNAAEMRKEADVLDTHTDMIVQSYLSRDINLSEDELRQAIADETWFTADEALTAGFIDAIEGEASPESESRAFDSEAINAYAEEYKGAFKYTNAPASFQHRLNAIRSVSDGSSAAKPKSERMSKYTQAELDQKVSDAVEKQVAQALKDAAVEKEDAVKTAVDAVHDKYEQLLDHPNSAAHNSVKKFARLTISTDDALELMNDVATPKTEDEKGGKGMSEKERKAIEDKASAAAIAAVRSELSDTKNLQSGGGEGDDFEGDDDVAKAQAAIAQAKAARERIDSRRAV